jgi:hypothetical protein
MTKYFIVTMGFLLDGKLDSTAPIMRAVVEIKKITHEKKLLTFTCHGTQHSASTGPK